MTDYPSNDKALGFVAQLLKEKLRGDIYWREGDIVEAELISKASREAYFDLGKFGTGIVYGQEYRNAKAILKKTSAGMRLSAKVVNLEGKDGYVELSLAEADEQRLWQQIK